MYWKTFHIIFFFLPIESLSCQRKAINNNEQEQDDAGAAPSTSPRSGGPTASGLGVPVAHGHLAWGLCGGAGLHPPSPSGPPSWEMLPTESPFAEQCWDLTGNSVGWFRAIVCTDEAWILDDQYKISLLFFFFLSCYRLFNWLCHAFFFFFLLF